MGKLVDLTGQRFGHWLVLEKAVKPGKLKDASAVWLCKCDCGNTRIVSGRNLRSGISKSCGCTIRKHGGNGTKLYLVWGDMKTRCNNPKSVPYKDYGARGITVCPEWRNSFENFRNWAFANGYQEGLTLDRIDNDGPYSPENCRWTTMKEQCNNRRSNHFLTYNGETHTLSQWAELRGMSLATLRERLFVHHWSVDKALNTPVRKKNSCNKEGAFNG